MGLIKGQVRTRHTATQNTHTHMTEKIVNKTQKNSCSPDQTKIPPINSLLPTWRNWGGKGKKHQVLTFSLVSCPVKADTVEATSQGSKEKFLLKTLVYTLTC